ncbi:MAG: YbjN domain-containing protein [Clostridia bacterium]|nr:YbjN domain-containing protein [Clostridia bacterium]
MAYSKELVSQLGDFLKSAGITAAFEERDGHALFSIRMKLRCKLQTAQMIILVRDDHFAALTTLPLAADENHRLAMAEFLTRINWGMRNGNFEMSMDTGEIRFKTYVHVGAQPLDPAAARLATLLPFLMIDRFGDALLEVLFGFKSPREAFESLPVR